MLTPTFCSQGVDIHATDFDGDTALHKAARSQFHVVYRYAITSYDMILWLSSTVNMLCCCLNELSAIL